MPAAAPPALPSRPAVWLFSRYVRRLARRHFASVHWNGGDAPAGSTESVLFVANHSNWWDGFLACLTGWRLGLSVEVLMDAANLQRYWMFRYVGALPLDRRSAVAGYRDLEAAAWHLRRPGTGLWIFPQGERRPASAPCSPLGHGAAQLWLRSGATPRICPVAIRCAYLGEQLPDAFVWIGESWRPAPPAPGSLARVRRELTDAIEERLTATLGELDARLGREDLAGFSVLEPGRLSINKRLDRVRRALGLLRGPFEPRNG